MKKGCFVTAIVLFTLIVGVVVYLVKYKKDSFKEFAKEKIINAGLSEFHSGMDSVKASIYKDSLRTDIEKFVGITKNLPFDKAIEEVQDVFGEARSIMKDMEIDSADYNHFKLIIARYERPKKN